MRAANIGVTVSVEDIDAALQFGKCFSSKKWVIFFRVTGVVAGLLFIFGIFASLSFPPYDDDTIACIIIGIIGGACCLGVDLILFFVFNSGKKKVKLWLQDFVVLRAITQKADETTEYRYPMISCKATAIQVRFSYLGKRFVKSSVQKGKISCLPIYNKYVDKEILIAYSPSTDNVMFIKPKSEQRILAELSK